MKLWVLIPLPLPFLAGLFQTGPGQAFNLTNFLMGTLATGAYFLGQLLIRTREDVVALKSTAAKTDDVAAIRTEVQACSRFIQELRDWKHDEVTQLLQVLRTNDELRQHEVADLEGRLGQVEERLREGVR